VSGRDRVSRLVRSTYEKLPDSTRTGIMRRRAELSGLGQLKDNQALLAMRVAELERRLDPEAVIAGPEVPDERFPAGVRSRLCTQAQVEEAWFEKWCTAMGEPPHAHRKMWEFAYIAQVLDQTGMLEADRRGLGFGVGREPLISLFADRGIHVTGTDLEPDAKEALGWARSDQHAHGVEGMMRPEVCDPDQFREHVTWRPVDMTDIPSDLRGYDFCWSACALEHLGSLEEGERFIEESIATLAPGGIAVHTTEFNVKSNDDTLETGPTVIYREKDLLALRDRLEAAGHEVAAFDFSRGSGLLDKYVDVPPYSDEPVLRFWASHYTLTSVAVVVRAGGGSH
jgi:SAM-dependent methyltransferase